ncbi:MAG TPA: prolyl oligopeptidase family serine peptidase, partial [Gemmatales bacterium]|nr:prolyl oligopeptidase family serine peptidase [Gemmatales bacterium]
PHAPPTYQRPPQAILDVLHAPAPPQVSFSPRRDRFLLMEVERYAAIEELAAPMLRLAGLRINPRNNGPHRPPRITGLKLVDVADGKTTPVTVQTPEPGAPAGTPSRLSLGGVRWAPDGSRFAFLSTTPDRIDLFVDREGTEARLALSNLNAAYGSPFEWLPDNQTLICKVIPSNRGPVPAAPSAPAGPIVQESYGKSAPVRTYQDLLQDAHDEALFEYYGTAQLVLLNTATGAVVSLGAPGLFSRVDPSPDGQFLLVQRKQRPFSYVLPASSFPEVIEVWNRRGEVVSTIARHPLQDQVPIEGVIKGPRGVNWPPPAPATLVWTEALDEGDPKKKVPHRDRVMMLALTGGAGGEPKELFRVQHRFAGMTWAAEGGHVLVRDFDRDTRRGRLFLYNADAWADAPTLLFERSAQDRYGDPGSPMMRPQFNGTSVMWQEGDWVYLSGPGASPQGDRPFVDRFNLRTKEKTRLFQSVADGYQSPLALFDAQGQRLLIRAESPTSPPNYLIAERSGEETKLRPLTHFTDPTPQLRRIKKQLVRYQRPDGVGLSFTLYLPPDYKEGQRLPAVVWAYPREFNDPALAGQVIGSTQRFTTLGGSSHLFFLLAGYAVLDDATMPVVGDPETANNTFVEQIVASAQAAIDKADELGVIDRQRVGVGGHSYGAFMTANLLAHSDLFKAGIARSGAFNRTLTPFGFQNERRTLWEAPDIYTRMSPFMFAHRIKAPILLIHGAVDNNSGTFPIQSERLYQAIRGNGGNVRFVSLPHESHGYVARESIEHTLYEMVSWFDKYVKGTESPTP